MEYIYIFAKKQLKDNSNNILGALVAHLAERSAVNRKVLGSIPSWSDIIYVFESNIQKHIELYTCKQYII